MRFSLQSSFLLLLVTIVIAIALSFLSLDQIFVSLKTRLENGEPSSLHGFLIHALDKGFCSPTTQQDHEEDDWNLFYHLGGNGPWIEKVDARYGTYEKDGTAPPGCVIDQVHMLARHAERYPTRNAGTRHLSLLSRLESYRLNGSLSFLNNNNWTYFTPPPESTPPTFEDLTTTSPHAGTLSAFRLGTTFRTRYSPLLASSKPINFWSASSPRDVETALYFGDGLFGRNWSQPSPPDSPNLHPVAKLHIIPETPDRGSNTLTPGCTCQNYMTNTTHGHALGYKKLAEWQSVFTTPIIARFSAENPRLQPPLSTVEIYSMMEMCGFEMLSRGPGSSPWCTVFRREEWEDFEYARDVLHFYRAGPGNRFAGVMGGLWLDATSKLLEQPSGGNGEGEVYVSFVHDGDIVSVLAALGVIHGEEEEELPTDQVLHNRTWRTSTLVPMAGRLVIERLNCRTPHGWRWRDVRLWINDGGVGLTGEGDKGKRVLIPQMEVGRFREMIKKKVEGYGSFREVCGLKDEEGEGITFLHQ